MSPSYVEECPENIQNITNVPLIYHLNIHLAKEIS